MWWINNIDYCMGWIIHLLQPTRHQTFSNTALSMQNLSLSVWKSRGWRNLSQNAMTKPCHVHAWCRFTHRPVCMTQWENTLSHSAIESTRSIQAIYKNELQFIFFLFSSNNSNICLVNTLHRNSSHFCAFHSVSLLIGAFLIVFDNVVRYLFFFVFTFSCSVLLIATNSLAQSFGK